MATDEEIAAGDEDDKQWIEAELICGDAVVASDTINNQLAIDRAMCWCEQQMEHRRAGSHRSNVAPPAPQVEIIPSLPLRNSYGPYSEVPWLAGRLADGRYSLETGEYQMIIDQADLRAWAQRIIDQVDADIARDSKKAT